VEKAGRTKKLSRFFPVLIPSPLCLETSLSIFLSQTRLIPKEQQRTLSASWINLLTKTPINAQCKQGVEAHATWKINSQFVK
jgi:hypothetical protein